MRAHAAWVSRVKSPPKEAETGKAAGTPQNSQEVAPTLIDGSLPDDSVEVVMNDGRGDMHDDKRGEKHDRTGVPSPNKPPKAQRVDPSSSPLESGSAGPDGVKLWDLGGCGDCGFRCLAGSNALRQGATVDKLEPKIAKIALSLRTKAADWLEGNQAAWVLEWYPDADCTEDTEGGSIPQDASQYLSACRRPSKWLDPWMTLAAAHVLQVEVLVFKHVQKKWKFLERVVPRNKTSSKPLFLFLKDQHFYTLRPEASPPAKWAKLGLDDSRPPASQSYLGGGRKSSPGSVSSAGSESSLWLRPVVDARFSASSQVPEHPPEKSSDDGASVLLRPVLPENLRIEGSTLEFRSGKSEVFPTTAKEARSSDALLLENAASETSLWLRPAPSHDGRSEGSRRIVGKRAPDFEQRKKPKQAEVASGAVSSEAVVGAGLKTTNVETPTWYCEECKEHVRPTSECKNLGRGLSQARTAHIARRHPGRPSSDFPRIREVATVDAMHQRKLKGKAAWKCFWCRQGLPAMEKRSREASIKKHLQQCKKAPPESTAGSNLQAWAQELDKSHASRGAQSRCWGMILSKKVQGHGKARQITMQKHKLGHRIRHVLRCENGRARVIFTCARCLRVARSRSALVKLNTPCPGVGDRARVLRTTGKQRLYTSVGAQGRRVLKRIWGLTEREHAALLTRTRGCSTAAPLKQWLRDVTEEGVEPNPGPSTSLACSLWSCFHLNAGGCTNAFEALDLLRSFEVKPLVWSLAEVRASPSEHAALTRRASKMGYKVWCVPSTQGARRQGPANWKGGLCVGVKEGVCCKQMATWCHDEGDLLQLDFGSFRYMAAWRRPGGLRAAFDAEVALWASHAVAAGHSLVAVGDWNDEPHESPFEELGYLIIGPKQQDRYLASRWKGSRAIDWAMTNDPQSAFKAKFLEHRISDHKCLWIEGCFSFNRIGQFSLSRTRDLSRPEHVPLEVWRDAVASHFENLEVHWDDDVDVQWTQLAAQLELSLQAASLKFAEPASRAFSRGSYRPKGSVARSSVGSVETPTSLPGGQGWRKADVRPRGGSKTRLGYSRRLYSTLCAESRPRQLRLLVRLH